MTDKPDDKKDEKEELTPTDLEVVHAQAVEKVENEDVSDDANEDDEPKDDDDSKDAEDKDESKDEADDDVQDTPPAPAEKPEPPKEPEEEADIVSTVEKSIPLVKIKDSDGKVHEFAKVDDIPEDFEPATYKELTVATSKLTRREMEVESKIRDAEADREIKERNERVEKIKSEWLAEEEALLKSGDLPKDQEERSKVVEAVYEIMQESSSSGAPINKFTQAFEIYQYRKGKEDAANEFKKADDEKKKKGSKVMSGGGGAISSKSSKGKVIEAPPSGISLDQLHENILGTL